MTKQSQFRLILKQLVPPIVPSFVRKVIYSQSHDELFRGHAEAFQNRLRIADCYGEYGCGASTVWVNENTSARIISVDSSREWIEKVASQTALRSNVELQHVDLGPLGDWGRPLSYANRSFIKDYISIVWRGERKPDTVLIDGRFRVACFLKSLLEADVGTYLFFDDYVGRLHFHLVEEFVEPLEYSGDQAIFVVPEDIDRRAVQAELEHFLYVMD